MIDHHPNRSGGQIVVPVCDRVMIRRGGGELSLFSGSCSSSCCGCSTSGPVSGCSNCCGCSNSGLQCFHDKARHDIELVSIAACLATLGLHNV